MTYCPQCPQCGNDMHALTTPNGLTGEFGCDACKHILPPNRMLKWFAFAHLPTELQGVSKSFHDLALSLCVNIAPGPEHSVALRKLLEAKDAAVRAKLHPTG